MIKKKRSRKAQIQLGENVVVLVVFFFLLVIAVVFYSVIQKGKISAKLEQAETLSLIDAKTMMSSIPELLCTENNDITESCIDIINLNMMKGYWESIRGNETSLGREYYNYRFGSSVITVQKLDTDSGVWTAQWVLYNNTAGMNYSIPVYIPVSLYNTTSGDYSFGVMEFRRFSRG